MVLMQNLYLLIKKKECNKKNDDLPPNVKSKKYKSINNKTDIILKTLDENFFVELTYIIIIDSNKL